MDWRQRAACKGMDTNIFFPESNDKESVKKARAICGVCPVIQECRAFNDQIEQAEGRKDGIWGGTSKYQRRKTNPLSGDIRTHCRNEHSYELYGVLVERRGVVTRRCRLCKSDTDHSRYLRRKAA